MLSPRSSSALFRNAPAGSRQLLAFAVVFAALVSTAPVAHAHGSNCFGPSDAAVLASSNGKVVAPPTNPPGSAPIRPGGARFVEDPRLGAARTSIKHARLDEAEATLRAVLSDCTPDTTTDETARLLLGELMLDEQRADEALDVLMPLDTVDTYDAQTLLGRAYSARGQVLADSGAHREDVGFHRELALASLDRAIELAPPGEVEAAINALQLSLYTLGDADGALALADRALERSPGEAEVLVLRGCAGGHAYWNASAAGDTERADALWERAVADLRTAQPQLADDRVEPWVQLSWLELQKAETLDLALEDAKQAADRGVPAPLFDVAVVGASRGDNLPAAAALFELTERAPAMLTQMLAARADAASMAERFSYAVFQSDGTYDEAREVHAALTAATRESSAVWNNYALLCRDTGVYDESYRAYTVALEINGPDARLLNDTALVLHYHLMGDDPELTATARRLYGEAIQLAETGLLAEDLTEGTRAELELALTDARNNLRLLDGAKLAGH